MSNIVDIDTKYVGNLIRNINHGNFFIFNLKCKRETKQLERYGLRVAKLYNKSRYGVKYVNPPNFPLSRAFCCASRSLWLPSIPKPMRSINFSPRKP